MFRLRRQDVSDIESVFGIDMWRMMVDRLVGMGYDSNNIVAMPYDWRLATDDLERRDRYLTRLRRSIEFQKSFHEQKVRFLLKHFHPALHYQSFWKLPHRHSHCVRRTQLRILRLFGSQSSPNLFPPPMQPRAAAAARSIIPRPLHVALSCCRPRHVRVTLLSTEGSHGRPMATSP